MPREAHAEHGFAPRHCRSFGWLRALGRRRRRENGHEEGYAHDETAPIAAAPVPIEGQPVEHAAEHHMPVEDAPFAAEPAAVTIEMPPPAGLPVPPEPPVVAAAPHVRPPAPQPEPPVVPAVPVIDAPPANPKCGWWRR